MDNVKRDKMPVRSRRFFPRGRLREFVNKMTNEEAEFKKRHSNETKSRYRFVVDKSKCIGCQVCVESCPNEVLETKDGCPIAIRPEACEGCEGCEVCVALCDQEAIEINNHKTKREEVS